MGGRNAVSVDNRARRAENIDPQLLLSRIENAFETSFDGQRAFGAATVGELCQVVQQALGSGPSRRSQVLHWRHRFRTALSELSGVHRRSLGGAAEMRLLAPRKGRRRMWRLLSRRLGHPLPRLRRPAWLEGVLRSYLVLASASLLGSCTGVVDPGRGVGLAIGFLLVLLLGYLLTLPLADRLPSDCRTLEATLRAFLRMNRKRLDDGYRSWHERDIRDRLRAIVADLKGVPPNAIAPDDVLFPLKDSA